MTLESCVYTASYAGQEQNIKQNTGVDQGERREENMTKCELCKRPASLYCESDHASLCSRCDAKVHEANFLVARHVRTLLCRTCQCRTPWEASGARLGNTTTECCKCADGCFEMGEDNEDEEVVEGSGENEALTWPRYSYFSLSPPAASSSSGDESSSTSSVCSRKRVSVKRMREYDAEQPRVHERRQPRVLENDERQ